MDFTRYAIYYAPPADAPWVQFATRWLGWDMVTGCDCDHPDLPLPIADITATPRKYGLHGTIKAPFHLTDGCSRADLEAACDALCATLAQVSLAGLTLTRMGRFLALCPSEPSPELNALAARCVQDLDPFRTPPAAADLARRRAANLTPEQDANLTRWGYPYVLDAFRFHITLSGKLAKAKIAPVQSVLDLQLAPLLPRPLTIPDIALTGQAPDGRFHLLRRFPLRG
ncbi:MAG: putative phosphonate metabolism protein [Paracoccaceae bacterium]|jgi:putative phosphonate metabolism protein